MLRTCRENFGIILGLSLTQLPKVAQEMRIIQVLQTLLWPYFNSMSTLCFIYWKNLVYNVLILIRRSHIKLLLVILKLLCCRLGSPRKRKGPISGTKGMDRFRSEETFYANPLPDCLCRTEPPSRNISDIIK